MKCKHSNIRQIHSRSNISQSCFFPALDDLCSELQYIKTPILQHRRSLITGEAFFKQEKNWFLKLDAQLLMRKKIFFFYNVLQQNNSDLQIIVQQNQVLHISHKLSVKWLSTSIWAESASPTAKNTLEYAKLQAVWMLRFCRFYSVNKIFTKFRTRE